MMSVKIGQSIIRQMEGFTLSKSAKRRGEKQKYWNYPGIVTEVETNGNSIICRCRLNPPDNILMEFDAKTGICTSGIDYGWLVEIAGDKAER